MPTDIKAMKEAIDKNNTDAVKKLLDDGFDLSVPLHGKVTAIEYAGLNEKDSIVGLIALAKNTDDTDTYHYGSALLEVIGRKKNLIATNLLKAGAARNWQRLSTGYYGLHLAIDQADHVMVNLLLGHSIYLTYLDLNKKIPLQLAVEQNKWQLANLIAEAHVTHKINKDNIATECLLFTLHNCADRNLAHKITRNLIKMGANVNAKDKLSLPFLHVAIRNNDSDMMDLLLANGADPFLGEKSALEFALTHDKYQIFENLLERFLKSLTKRDKQALLEIAVNKGLFDQVALLLQAGADINGVSGKDLSAPLHNAVVKGNAALVRFLLKQGADQSVTNKDNKTVIEFACANATDEVISALLEDPNFKTAYQKKPSIAIPAFLQRSKPNLNLLALLLEKGAHINEQDPITGKTALHCAANQHIDGIMRFVLSYNPDPTLKTATDESPLDISAKSAGLNSRLLIEKYGDKFSYFRPAKNAIEAGDFYILELILKQDKSVCNETSSKGNVLLFAAINKNAPQLVTLLLEYGADPDVKNERGQTMEEYAKILPYSHSCYQAIVDFKKKPKVEKKKSLDEMLLYSEEIYSKFESNGIAIDDLSDTSVVLGNHDRYILVTAIEKINERIATLKKTRSPECESQLRKYENLRKIGDNFANQELKFDELKKHIVPLQGCDLPETKYLLNFILHLKGKYDFKLRVKNKIDEFKHEISATDFKIINKLFRKVSGTPGSITLIKDEMIRKEKNFRMDQTGLGPMLSSLAYIIRTLSNVGIKSTRDDITTDFYNKWLPEFKKLRFTQDLQFASSELVEQKESLLDLNQIPAMAQTPVLQPSVLTAPALSVDQPIATPLPVSIEQLLSEPPIKMSDSVVYPSSLYPNIGVVSQSEMKDEFSNPPPLYSLGFGSTGLMYQGLQVTNAAPIPVAIPPSIVHSLPPIAGDNPRPAIVEAYLKNQHNAVITSTSSSTAIQAADKQKYAVPASVDAKLTLQAQKSAAQSRAFEEMLKKNKFDREEKAKQEQTTAEITPLSATTTTLWQFPKAPTDQLNAAPAPASTSSKQRVHA